MNISDIRAALEHRLGQLPGLQAHRSIPEAVNHLPAIVIGSPTIGRRAFQRGVYELVFPIYLMGHNATAAEGQAAVDAYILPEGDRSVEAAIWAEKAEDRRLGGLIDDLDLKDFRPFNLEEHLAIGAWGGEWPLHIYARRT